MSHSPFPWSTHPQAPTNVFDADGMKVATTIGRTAADNAALIAAIPAMVEALEAIAGCEDPRGDFASNFMMKTARAVLASIGKKP